MIATTIFQPYAHLIRIGEKPLENRRKEWRYRGDMAIHAGKSLEMLDEDDRARYPDLAFGAIVAVANIVACLPKGRESDRAKWGRWAHLFDHEHAYGPWCLVLEELRPLKQPVPCRGNQGLWPLPPDVEAAVRAQLAEVRA
jgi:activating signal cointegrator 1